MLEIKNVTKIFNSGEATEHRLFHDFELSVEKGEFVSVVGGNGSGKTSLLNIICGSLPIERGDILIDGKSIVKEKDFVRCRRIGRVHQNPAMGTAPNLTVMENLSLADNKGKTFGLSFGINKKRKGFYRGQLSDLGLGLEDKLDVKMGALSGGQRQAISLLMATLTPIDFLVLDEHTAALDPKTAEVIMQLTDRLIREKKLTAIMVTHNLRYALEYGSRLIMMDRGTVVLDKKGDEKARLSSDEVFERFNKMSTRILDEEPN